MQAAVQADTRPPAQPVDQPKQSKWGLMKGAISAVASTCCVLCAVPHAAVTLSCTLLSLHPLPPKCPCPEHCAGSLRTLVECYGQVHHSHVVPVVRAVHVHVHATTTTALIATIAGVWMGGWVIRNVCRACVWHVRSCLHVSTPWNYGNQTGKARSSSNASANEPHGKSLRRCHRPAICAGSGSRQRWRCMQSSLCTHV